VDVTHVTFQLQEFLKPELGEETVRLMHTIKRTIDPDNLFNPGKIYVDIKPTQRE
jgi:D-lactate dehydrogenase (cytochrome)